MVYAEEYNIQLIRVASNLIKIPNIQISLINPVDNIMMFVRDCCHLSQCTANQLKQAAKHFNWMLVPLRQGRCQRYGDT